MEDLYRILEDLAPYPAATNVLMDRSRGFHFDLKTRYDVLSLTTSRKTQHRGGVLCLRTTTSSV
jgi:hypothetical protein